MFCKYCKAEIKKGNKFCPYCGKKIIEGDSTTESKEESTYNDPFKDYRIDNNSHQDQYNYQISIVEVFLIKILIILIK